MLTGFAPPTAYPKQARHKDTAPSSAINCLLVAAVVNKKFRSLLLTDPGLALAQGYQGETFSLDDKERTLVLSIQADNLRDFALKIASSQEGRSQSRSGEWIPVNQNTLVLEPE